MEALGLRVAQADGGHVPAAPPEPPEVYLWPCNAAVWGLWERVQTQWDVGMAGPTGLRYEGVRVVMGFCGLPKKERAWAFECIQAMERAVLGVLADRPSGGR